MISATARRRLPSLAAVAVGLVAFALARATLLPGVWYWDTGEAQTVGPLLGVAHPTGFPAYTILGWLASVVLQPFGEPAFRMNLLSAALLAVSAGVTVLLVRLLGAPLPLAVAAGIGLATTPEAWRIGTRADAHALHLALVVVLLLLLVAWERRARPARAARHRDPTADRLLIAAAGVYGVSAANHSLTLLLAPPIALYVLVVDPGVLRRPRLVAAALVAATVAAGLLYLELPLRAGPFRAPLVYGDPSTWEGFRYVVLAEQFRGSIDVPLGAMGRLVGDLAARASAQLGLLAPLVPVAFLAAAWRRPHYALLSGTALAFTVAFSLVYENADIGRYYLGPIVIVWTWLALLGASVVDLLVGRPPGGGEDWQADDERRIRTWLAVGLAVVLLVPSAVELPDRYRAVDRSGDRSAEGWLDRTLAAVAPDAVVVSWWSYSTPLWYAQLVEGRRPDIDVVDDRTRLDRGLGEVTDVIDSHLGARPVYVIRAAADEIAALRLRYELRLLPGTDVVYEVLPPEEPA